ncbi:MULTISPECIES: c-type cytochrome biogenesis protein CcsB [unclassified Leifsonia]|uniref:c-type cytochrome biogenesis protein CcsB n=1 Tax=unclassified Leifsonia TaxID=2663824 RepID=UPI0009EB5025|nr:MULTISPECIES: c-type cytochrome biogenesis protein CcsB [unclassified Leifsonia]
MAVYAIAFIAYAIDLAKRSSSIDEVAVDASSGAVASARSASPASAAAATTTAQGYGSTATLAPSAPETDAARGYGRSAALRVGVALTVVAWLLHLSADILRGLAAGRVPWANMYEFAMTGTLVIVAVFLIANLFVDLRFLGTFVTGLVLILLGLASVNFYVAVSPLPPALQSIWLVIHVFVAATAVGLFALGFGLSVVQLMQFRRESNTADAQSTGRRLLATLPSSTKLEALAYRINIIGFILWTFTLMAGAIWAEKAWGRYWGWDTKEVWTFIIWVIYAGYIHARATRGWRGSRSAWLAIIGFSAVLFNFTIVNLFFKGLHAYSGL